jgi:hypothetical protein
MRFTLQSKQRSSYASVKPTNTYRTTLVWSGTACYNTQTQTGTRFFSDGRMETVPYPMQLSRVDHTEDVTVCVYSEHIWSENDDLFIVSK